MEKMELVQKLEKRIKRLKKRIIILLSVSFILCVVGVLIEDEKLVATDRSPDGNLVLYLYKSVDSDGPLKGSIVLRSSEGKKLDQEKFSLLDDGTDVYEFIIKETKWLENQVEVTIGEADTEEQYIYVLDYAK